MSVLKPNLWWVCEALWQHKTSTDTRGGGGKQTQGPRSDEHSKPRLSGPPWPRRATVASSCGLSEKPSRKSESHNGVNGERVLQEVECHQVRQVAQGRSSWPLRRFEERTTLVRPVKAGIVPVDLVRFASTWQAADPHGPRPPNSPRAGSSEPC
jgi:hypothetical protein